MGGYEQTLAAMIKNTLLYLQELRDTSILRTSMCKEQELFPPMVYHETLQTYRKVKRILQWIQWIPYTYHLDSTISILSCLLYHITVFLSLLPSNLLFLSTWEWVADYISPITFNMQFTNIHYLFSEQMKTEEIQSWMPSMISKSLELWCFGTILTHRFTRYYSKAKLFTGSFGRNHL